VSKRAKIVSYSYIYQQVYGMVHILR